MCKHGENDSNCVRTWSRDPVGHPTSKGGSGKFGQHRRSLNKLNRNLDASDKPQATLRVDAVCGLSYVTSPQLGLRGE